MTWKEALAPIKNSDHFTEMMNKVDKEYEQFFCFPPKKDIFRALKLTAFEEVKVVIIGQDPYHSEYQANGLSFSVSDKVKAPPSLRNIFQELESDLGIVKNTNELDSWAQQGVLMLNATLTVRAHEPNSHRDFGWQTFTDYIIKSLSDNKENIVFVLWGAFAQKKEELIDAKKHYIIKSPHPSPFSAHRGFFGSRPFSKINNYLKQSSQSEIHW